jgi:pimeloyl-ACP methyl ester carboxylesterase
VSNVTRKKQSSLASRASSGAGRAARAERSNGWCGRAVVLPGSGSDDLFVRFAFEAPLRAVGIELVSPSPRHGADVVDGYRAALDAAAADPQPLLVGGVSLGAHVAASWAADRRADLDGRLGGLLLALPAWAGDPGSAPAAVAARATAAQVRRGGTTAALAAAAAGSPPWLIAELARSWPRYGDGLAAALEAAAAEPGPDAAALGSLRVPAGIAALVDDPVHPLAEARRWQRWLPNAALSTTTLAALGADPSVLGRAAVRGWLRARQV